MSNSVKIIGISIFFMFITSSLLACNETIVSTISFESNGGSLVSPIETEDISSINMPSDPEKDGFTFEGWYWDNDTLNNPFNSNTLQDQATSHQFTVYAKWIINQFDISYVLNDGINHQDNPTSFNAETDTIQLNNPYKEGFTFHGWFINATFTGNPLTEISTETTVDITLYAKWEINDYVISYELDEGTNHLDNPITYSIDTLTITLHEPERVGYTFEGWYLDIELTIPFVFEYMPAEDITLFAKWQPNSYTITFETNGDHPIDSIIQEYGLELEEPPIPTKEGYLFDGCYTEPDLLNRYTFSIMSHQSITLFGKWLINSYTLSFVTNSETIIDPMTLQFGEELPIEIDINKDNYTFAGWFLDTEFSIALSFNVMPANHLTLYAKWIVNQHIINYYIFSEDNPSEVSILLSSGETVTSITSGGKHTVLTTSNRRVFAWGSNTYGQLGDGTMTNKTAPTEISCQFLLSVGEIITMIVLYEYHSAALTSRGRVFTWGWNRFGQLGDGTTTNKSKPTEITDKFNLIEDEIIISLSLGYSHSTALTSLGRVYTWGANGAGQLGDGEPAYSISTPKEITSYFDLNEDEKVTSLSLGYRHSAALTSEGRIFTWGNNDFGQLGDGTKISKHIPTDITSHFNLDIDETMILHTLGAYHSGALTSAGRMFTFGHNGYYQLGDFTSINKSSPTEITNFFNLDIDENITILSFGLDHSGALTSTGRIFTWGFNYKSQLGDRTTNVKSTPFEVTSLFDLDIDEEIVELSLGFEVTTARTSKGKALIWGSNEYGQLGDGTTQRRFEHYEIALSKYIANLSHVEIFNYNEDIVEYVPILEGYTFSGWYRDHRLTVLYVFSKMPSMDLTLYGYWIKN
jgi:uncharacterized repeat protein (TIGR02543 family)